MRDPGERAEAQGNGSPRFLVALRRGGIDVHRGTRVRREEAEKSKRRAGWLADGPLRLTIAHVDS